MTGETAAPAEMPVVEEIARALSVADGYHPDACSNDADEQPMWQLYTKQARAILDLFAPILAEKEAEAEQWQNLFESTRASQQQEINKLEARALAAEAAITWAENGGIGAAIGGAAVTHNIDLKGHQIKVLSEAIAAAIRAQGE